MFGLVGLILWVWSCGFDLVGLVLWVRSCEFGLVNLVFLFTLPDMGFSLQEVALCSPVRLPLSCLDHLIPSILLSSAQLYRY